MRDAAYELIQAGVELLKALDRGDGSVMASGGEAMKHLEVAISSLAKTSARPQEKSA